MKTKLKHLVALLSLISFLILGAISSCSKSPDSTPPVVPAPPITPPAGDKIRGKVMLPSGTNLNVNSLAVYSALEATGINKDSFALTPTGSPFATQLVLNANDEIVMMGYSYPGQPNNDITPQSTALAMLMNAPVIQSLSREGRLETIKNIVSNTSFKTLVQAITDRIIKDKKLLDEGNTDVAMAQAYAELFAKVAILGTADFRPKPINLTVTGKIIGLQNNGVAHHYVAGFYKNNVLQDKKVIKGTQLFASSVLDAVKGVFGSGYSSPDLQQFEMLGDGAYSIKLRSGKPGESDGTTEFREAQKENISHFIGQWILENIPLGNECLDKVKENVLRSYETITDLPAGNSAQDLGMIFLKLARTTFDNTAGLFESCTNVKDPFKTQKYFRVALTLFKYLDLVGKVGDGMNVSAHVFDLYNSKPAIDTCFQLSGTKINPCFNINDYEIELYNTHTEMKSIGNGTNSYKFREKVIPGQTLSRNNGRLSPHAKIKYKGAYIEFAYRKEDKAYKSQFSSLGLAWQVYPNGIPFDGPDVTLDNHHISFYDFTNNLEIKFPVNLHISNRLYTTVKGKTLNISDPYTRTSIKLTLDGRTGYWIDSVNRSRPMSIQADHDTYSFDCSQNGGSKIEKSVLGTIYFNNNFHPIPPYLWVFEDGSVGYEYCGVRYTL